MKNIITLVIIIGIIIGGVWWYRTKYMPNDSDSGSSTMAVANASKVGQKTLALLNQLNTLNLDASIFTDPAYTGLQDYSVSIPEQNAGRLNPFAPLPFSISSSAKKATITVPSLPRR